MHSALAQNLLAYAGAAAGAAAAVSIGVSHRKLCALISFAAGTLFATTFFHILPEAWPRLPALAVGLALGSGYLLFFLISRYVFHVCPACAASHFEEQTAANLKAFVVLLAAALTVHCAMDGLALVFGTRSQEETGRSILITVFAHKIPEGLALCAMFLRAGYESRRALRATLLLETTTFAGWLLGLLFLRSVGTGVWLDLALLHIGGGFVYLAMHATLNEMETHSPRFIFLFFLSGMILIGLIP